jgi:hypothetical protein
LGVGIPGLNAKFEVRAKVRIGEKNERNLPTSVDYFVSDDVEFGNLYDRGSSKPNKLRIVLPHDSVDECFSTGLEWWVKKASATKSTLACYTKGDGTALRKTQMLSEDDVKRGEPVGQDRTPIVCRFRDCPIFKRGKDGCKPMGRLIFFLEGGRTDQVLELDTKSWNSIERLTAALQGARIKGPLTGRVFDLSVAFESKGANRFPLLSIQEVDVQINSEQDVQKAEGLLAIERNADKPANVQLAAYLDETMEGWRDREDVIARIKEVGPEAALAKVKEQLA